MAGWEKVYSTEQLYKAEIVKDILEEHGLSPIVLNKKESALHIGLCEVLVIRDEVLQALKIIEDDIKLE